jgi:hypothetical protein
MGSHRLVVIALGHLFAYYLDDIPLLFFDDQANPSGRMQIQVGASQGVAKVIIDNLKFWNLANYTLESMQLSVQIMDLIAQGQPELKEDFSEPDDSWFFKDPGSQWGDGVAQLIVDDSEVGFDGPFQSNDFALRLTLVPREIHEYSRLFLIIRENQGNLYEFEYFPATGVYIFKRVSGHPEQPQETELGKGTMKALPVNTAGTLLIIAKGKYFWVYLNDELFFSQENDQILAGHNTIFFDSYSGGQAQIDIDLVEYWNLDSLK